jgi:hypothetical protein
MEEQPATLESALQAIDKVKALLLENAKSASESQSTWEAIQAKAKQLLSNLKPRIRLNVGGEMFTTSKTTLLRFPVTVLSVMLSTEIWQPQDGVYFFDRNSHGFDHVLDYLSDGSVRLDILSETELSSVKDHLTFLSVPFQVDTVNKGASQSVYYHMSDLPMHKLTHVDPIPSSLSAVQLNCQHWR